MHATVSSAAVDVCPSPVVMPGVRRPLQRMLHAWKLEAWVKIWCKRGHVLPVEVAAIGGRLSTAQAMKDLLSMERASLVRRHAGFLGGGESFSLTPRGRRFLDLLKSIQREPAADDGLTMSGCLLRLLIHRGALRLAADLENLVVRLQARRPLEGYADLGPEGVRRCLSLFIRCHMIRRAPRRNIQRCVYGSTFFGLRVQTLAVAILELDEETADREETA